MQSQESPGAASVTGVSSNKSEGAGEIAVESICGATLQRVGFITAEPLPRLQGMRLSGDGKHSTIYSVEYIYRNERRCFLRLARLLIRGSVLCVGWTLLVGITWLPPLRRLSWSCLVGCDESQSLKTPRVLPSQWTTRNTQR